MKIYTIFIILSTYTCNNIFKYSYESPYKAPILPLMLLPSVHQQLSLFTVLQFPSLTTFITHYSNLKNTCWVILASSRTLVKLTENLARVLSSVSQRRPVRTQDLSSSSRGKRHTVKERAVAIRVGYRQRTKSVWGTPESQQHRSLPYYSAEQPL